MGLTKLLKAINAKERRIIGLMSGMSMDGIDLALIKVKGVFPDLQIELEETYYRKYSGESKLKIEAGRTGNVEDVCRLNFLVAKEFSKCVNDFIKDKEISKEDIHAIGSHGQSLYHVPVDADRNPSTLQIGSGSVIAELTGIPTVFNFRVRDMIVGGEAAPLIPLLDFVTYRRPNEIVALNNLGSISNVTVVSEEIEDVIAFDTGPANMPIDYFSRKIQDNKYGYDWNGEFSRDGIIQADLLSEMLSIPFLRLPPPKAAGYSEFGPSQLDAWFSKYKDRNTNDLVRTAVEFSAKSIADAYRKFVSPRYPHLHKIIFTGGGVYNQTLMNRIRELLPDFQVESAASQDSQFNNAKEAIGFALLANETLSGRPGNVRSATGASKSVVLGEIAP